jgi:hypothetical protein
VYFLPAYFKYLLDSHFSRFFYSDYSNNLQLRSTSFIEIKWELTSLQYYTAVEKVPNLVIKTEKLALENNKISRIDFIGYNIANIAK